MSNAALKPILLPLRLVPVLLSIVVLCAAFWSLPDAQAGGSHGDGWKKRGGFPGFGGGIMITIPTHRPEREFQPEPEFEEPPQRVAECGPGEVFSNRRGACVCRKGFARVDGECLAPVRQPPKVASCDRNEVFSKTRGSCVCRKGFVRIGDGCDRPPVVVEQPKRKPKPEPVVVQKPKPEPVALQKPQPLLEQPAAPRTVRQANIAAPQACLDPDLYDMLKQAYGREPASINRCDAACLAKPANLAEPQLADMTKRFGVQWCDDCVKLGGWLPLNDIQRLEQLTGQTFCMAGANFCSAPGYARVDPAVMRTKVVEIIRQLPATLGKDGDIAVVIGNGTYQNGIEAKTNGRNDADAVTTLLIDKLGYKKQNVIDLRDATLSDFQRVFGGKDGVPGELAKQYSGKGDIFIYISAQGLREEASGKSYLLPVDAKQAELAGTAYSLDELYSSLGILGARTIMLALETSFGSSLTSLVDPPNLPESEAAVLPETPVPGLAVFTASDRDQRTLDDPEFGLGLFTRYLVEGMAGKADEAPTGNADRQLDSVELYVYVASMVRTAARKSLGLEQKPQLSKVENLLIGRLAAR
ncbi:MAG: caspase family protein [Parvibaculaceae bacterium]